MATSWDIYDLSVSSSRAEDSEGSNTDKEKPSSPDVSSSHHFESNRGLQRTMSRVSATSTGKCGIFIYRNFHVSALLVVIIM